MIVKRKVVAYITRADRLLVFTHPLSPEAGIQVPAGTLEAGESPEVGALREAQEETGLTYLTIKTFLGEKDRQFSPEIIHHRYFYHLICEEDAPETWRHGESTPSEGTETFIPFDLYWVNLPYDVPQLAAEQGAMIEKLCELSQF